MINSKEIKLFHELCSRYNGGEVKALTKFLPDEEITAINDPKTAAHPSLLSNKNGKNVSGIHYSWFQPLILKIPTPLQPLYLASLPFSQKKSLAGLLKIESSPFKMAGTLQPFFFQRFLKRYGTELSAGSIPLPESPLTPLLDLEKKELLKIIDFLGLHDLAEEMRYIVDKKKLGHIYNSLSPSMQSQLRVCLKQKFRLPASRLSLDNWSGTNNQLLHLIHKRGLSMLSKAISGQDQRFAWKLSRFLDTGRGELLLKHYRKTPYQKITDPLVAEIKQLLKQIKIKRES